MYNKCKIFFYIFKCSYKVCFLKKRGVKETRRGVKETRRGVKETKK